MFSEWFIKCFIPTVLEFVSLIHFPTTTTTFELYLFFLLSIKCPFCLSLVSQFLRLSWDTPPSMVYTLMTAHWGLPAPNLVVSVVGGEGRTKVKTWVREVLRQGLVKASQSTGKHMMKANCE